VGDAEHPGQRPPALGLIAPCTLPDPQENFLQEIFRQLPVGDDTQQERIRRPGIPIVETIERSAVTGSQTR